MKTSPGFHWLNTSTHSGQVIHIVRLDLVESHQRAPHQWSAKGLEMTSRLPMSILVMHYWAGLQATEPRAMVCLEFCISLWCQVFDLYTAAWAHCMMLMILEYIWLMFCLLWMFVLKSLPIVSRDWTACSPLSIARVLHNSCHLDSRFCTFCHIM